MYMVYTQQATQHETEGQQQQQQQQQQHEEAKEQQHEEAKEQADKGPTEDLDSVLVVACMDVLPIGFPCLKLRGVVDVALGRPTDIATIVWTAQHRERASGDKSQHSVI